MEAVVIVAVVVVGILFFFSRRGKIISPVTVKTLIDQGAQIIDVRSPTEFSQGHLKAAQNIPLQSIDRYVSKLSKDKDLILHCLSGARSAQALNILKANGFTKVHNIGSYERAKALIEG